MKKSVQLRETDFIENFTDEDEAVIEIQIKVDPGQQPQRIDKFISTKIANISRNKIQKALESDCVSVNGVAVKASYKVKGSDSISVTIPKTTPNHKIIPQQIPLNIVYEDDFLMVINKPPGMVVHPAHGNWYGTLVNGLIYYFDNLPYLHGNLRPGILHRIDKDTSGLLLVAKTEDVAFPLAKQFFNHTISRTYQAVVWGELKKYEGTVANFIGRSSKDRKIMAVLDDNDSNGKWAVTHYKVLNSYKYVSLVECTLETGRTHQIRVHMKHIGHPIFNDTVYGGNKILKGVNSGSYRSFISNCFEICNRQALHAKTLGFFHPVKQQTIMFDSTLPDDMQQLIDKFKNYIKNE